MSGGEACKCDERNNSLLVRRWRVIQYRYNQPAFNGFHFTSSKWSAITCLVCNASWRTKERYADALPAFEISLDNKQ
jgi:hypothetical protein